MALRSHNTVQPSSPDPSTDDNTHTPSTSISPPTLPISLTPLPMARAPSSEPPVAESSRAVTYRTGVDMPRNAAATRGGCWTCRLRRKKCDEQRQDDSCQTCIRLKIKCLGWGSRRPEWMRDKQAVDAYKAEIKAQLSRAGLIRGQPRIPPPSPPTPVVPSHSHPPPEHFHTVPSTAGPGPSVLPRHEDGSCSPSYNSFPGLVRAPLNSRYAAVDFAPTTSNSLISMIPSGPTSGPQRVPISSYSENNITTLNTTQLYGFSSTQPSTQPTTPLSTTSDHFRFKFSQGLTSQQQPETIGVSSLSSSVPVTAAGQTGGASAGYSQYDVGVSHASPQFTPQTSMQHVLYYFEHVRKLQYIFAGNSVTNATYAVILQEPHGAVTNAVCALANLHYQRMRVARGLEAPEANSEQSLSRYFHDEAYLQLVNAQQLRGRYNESDAIAALHLVSFSLLSGGSTDWRPVLTVALDWLGQTGLAADENPRLAMLNMNYQSQIALKIVLWLDVFSSLTLMRPPKFLGLCRRLLAGSFKGGGGGSGGYWTGTEIASNDGGFDMRMEALTGCPDQVMLAIAEVSALAHWKDTESNNGSLSVRELVRRGDDIERRLLLSQQQRQHAELVGFSEADRTPLHPSLSLEESGPSILPFLDEDMKRTVGSIYHETVLLYLYTVLNDAYPGVPEITESVGKVIQLLSQLPPSEIDRSLMFPLCLAGCMTDDPSRRDMIKSRLQGQEQHIGNLMQARAVMESIWQKRDAHGGVIDWRETMRDHNLNLLLV